jgi:MoaA/NifB/PqqE/SkfB family radical SAM enzyme
MPIKSIAERFLSQVPQYTRNKRHARSAWQHGTLRKWANLATMEFERKMRRVRVTGYPYILFLDPCNYCNLRCPLCATGRNDLGRPQAMLSLEHFKRYFDPFAPYLFEINMHNWGESLLNKNVYGMIEHAQRSNVGTNLSSNFVKLDSDDLDNILDCGLEYLIASIDGTTQETYEKYRVRGNLERVMENLAELLRRRNARRSKTPVIEWQFIVMRHNQHQIHEAESMAKKLGVDLLRFIPVGLPYDAPNRKELAAEWFPKDIQGRTESDGTEQQFSQKNKPSPCFYLYRSFVINPDGGVSPCCIVSRQKTDFANLNDIENIDVLKIYNNEFYQSGRSLFRKEKSVGHVRTTCDGCDIFARSPANPVRYDDSATSASTSGGFVAVDEIDVRSVGAKS